MEHQMQYDVPMGEIVSVVPLETQMPALQVAPPVHTVEFAQEKERVRCAISRLRRHSPIRPIALQTLDQFLPENLDPLLKALARPFSTRWREAQLAAWVLGRTSWPAGRNGEAVKALTRVLRVPVPRTNTGRLTKTTVLAVFLIAFSLALVMMGRELLINGIAMMYFLIGLIASTFGFGFVILLPLLPMLVVIDGMYMERRRQVRATTTRALGRLAAPESVDVLAATLQDPTPDVHEAALRALVPLLTSEHRRQWGPRVIPALCRALSAKSEVHVLEYLEALDKVGDGSAIVAVAQQARRGHTAVIRSRAAEILLVLEARRMQDEAPRHLLRASSNAATTPDVLLRAAAHEDVVEDTHLLRASHAIQD